VRTRPLLLAALLALRLPADEGMWTFEQLPREKIQARCGFVPDQAWLDHLRLATVMFGDGGTGSFVGPDGLVLTNQHLVHRHLQQLSSDRRDLVQEGFLARTQEEELPIPGLRLRVLADSRNVTAELDGSGQGAGEAEAALLRRESARTGLSCEIVRLWQGAEAWLYAYRVFDDVRLVMVPEYAIAAFGKEWDNFAYPRHDLDFALLRVYENGAPCHPGAYLAWSRSGLANGEPAFVAGFPGHTDRLEPVARMDFRRRVLNPLVVRTLERNIATLSAYAAEGAAQAREVSGDLMEASNCLKVYREEIRGLEDPAAMALLRSREQALRDRIRRLPAASALAGRSWEALESLLRKQERLAPESQLLHQDFCSLERGPLYRALRLVRLINEASGQSGEERAATRKELLEAGPIRRSLETLLLRDGLEEARAWLGPGHPLTRALLGGGDPLATARRAMEQTRLDDPDFLRELLAGDAAALAQCQDPLVRLALALDPLSRSIQARQDALDAQVDAQLAAIAKARALVERGDTYPDAAFTLRLSYGTVRPLEAEGTLVQPFTTFGGLFDRADAWGPEAEQGSWALPPRWLARRRRLEPSTPLNFITDHDIVGGNSGSPVVNRKGELVGLVFDGNIRSIPGRFYYDARVNRCVSVDARAILEALRTVYDADALAAELTAP
jgi:hypothetical protein